MTLLGIEIKRPPTSELALLAAYITVLAVIGAVGSRFGLVPAELVAPMVSAMAAGAILSAFGVSVVRGGWRAAVLVVAAATVFWLLLKTFGLL